MTGDRRNNLDLLRLLFASMVIVAHAYELTTGRPTEPLVSLFGTLTLGDLGVDCFFILSGFLISESWARDPHIGAYLFKRVRRIYPGYLVAFWVSVVAAGLFVGGAFFTDLSAVELLKNLVALHPPVTPSTYAGTTNPVANAPMWTLFYEFACYLALMGIGLSGALRKGPAILAAFAVMAISAICLRNDVAQGGHLYVVVRFALMFLSGVVFRLYGLHLQRGALRVASAAAILLICFPAHALVEVAMATCGAYLILVAGHSRPIMRPMPDISYGTYLYGWPVQQWILPLVGFDPLKDAVLSIPVALLCGWISYIVVESRAAKYKPSDMRNLFLWLGSLRPRINRAFGIVPGKCRYCGCSIAEGIECADCYDDRVY